MNAPAQGMLKVVSILFIIFGAIATIVSIAAVIASAALTAIAGELAGGAGAAIGGLLMVATILALINSVFELVVGIMGVGKKKTADPSKAGFYIVTGIILCVLALITLILTMTNGGSWWTSAINFVLPILYIVGGFQNKKAAVAPVQ